jgi:hypothetical protein
MLCIYLPQYKRVTRATELLSQPFSNSGMHQDDTHAVVIIVTIIDLSVAAIILV